MNTKVDEGKLISGDEAKKAWANKIPLEYTSDALGEWFDVNNSNTLGIFERSDFKFRFAPRTILINGIEVPAPFKPKDGDKYYYIDTNRKIGYDWDNYDCETTDENRATFGAWQTEEEAQQVVSALRQVFGGSHDN